MAAVIALPRLCQRASKFKSFPSLHLSLQSYHTKVTPALESLWPTPHEMGFTDEAVDIITALQQRQSSLPSVVYLYDEKGSALFEEITKQPEYYLTRSEQNIIETHAESIALFPDEVHQRNDHSANAHSADTSSDAFGRNFSSLLIELGAGSGKKMKPILDANERLHVSTAELKCTYIPVDCSVDALQENATVYNNFDTRSSAMVMRPFVGINEDAMTLLSCLPGRKSYIFLGSSLGNYVDPVPFLKNLQSHLGPRDRVLLGVDLAPSSTSSSSSSSLPSTSSPHTKSVDVVTAAYNDAVGVTADFILNSLSVVNSVAGTNFDEADFKLLAEYSEAVEAVNIYAECVRACHVIATSPTDQTLDVASFEPGSRIFIEQSGKFSPERLDRIVKEAGLVKSRQWHSDNGYFSFLELLPNFPAQSTQMCEFIFGDLVGESNLSKRPVKLRNPWAFYWGHIPAFTDKFVLQLPHREWERENFERGIDPDVNDPVQCHEHSELLEVWPSPEKMRDYAREVEQHHVDRIIARGVLRDDIVALEHADMHNETLMYIGNECGWQRSDVVHPYNPFAVPPRPPKVLPIEQPPLTQISGKQVVLGASTHQIGTSAFVWDNEVPQHAIDVATFAVSPTAVTNAQFARFVKSGGYNDVRLWGGQHSDSWLWLQRQGHTKPWMWNENCQDQKQPHRVGVGVENGSWRVRTLCDGPVDFAKGSWSWPAMVTLLEARLITLSIVDIVDT